MAALLINKRLIIWFSLLAASCADLHASVTVDEKITDLGVYGALFEIAEEDMLLFLSKRLESLKDSGKLQQIENMIKEKAKDRVLNPLPVEGLSETTEERSYLHDPTLVIDQDIKTPDGVILGRKGQKINPLNHVALSKGLLFIDGTREHQLRWALQHQDKYYIILIKGSPLKLEEQHSVKLYFDQGGIITNRYEIQHIPARIEQEGDLLRVTEFVIPKFEEEGS